ncbi:MAG: hypothetical protein QW728_01230 [Thermoplasmata archaeon]
MCVRFRTKTLLRQGAILFSLEIVVIFLAAAGLQIQNAGATTFNSINAADGLITTQAGGWADDEKLGNDSLCTYYLTWNETHFFAGWLGPNLDEYDVYIAFDTEKTVGVSSEYGGVQFIASSNNEDTALPDFAIWFKKGIDPQHLIYQPHNQDYSGWDAVQDVSENPDFTHYGGHAGNNNFSELAVPKAWLNYNDASSPFRVWMWVTTENAQSLVSSWPSNPTGPRPQVFVNSTRFENTSAGVSPGHKDILPKGDIKFYTPLVSDLTRNAASIEVTVDKPANLTLVLSKTSTAQEIKRIFSNTSTSSHLFNISGLEGGISYSYYFIATSADASNQSEVFNFTTPVNSKPTLTMPVVKYNETAGVVNFSVNYSDADGDTCSGVSVYIIKTDNSFNTTLQLNKISEERTGTAYNAKYGNEIKLEEGTYNYSFVAKDDYAEPLEVRLNSSTPLNLKKGTPDTKDEPYCSLVLFTFIIPAIVIIGAGILIEILIEKWKLKKERQERKRAGVAEH